MKIDLGTGILFDLWGLNDSLISEYNGKYLHLIWISLLFSPSMLIVDLSYAGYP